jgi:hypothetical protein
MRGLVQPDDREVLLKTFLGEHYHLRLIGLVVAQQVLMSKGLLQGQGVWFVKFV